MIRLNNTPNEGSTVKVNLGFRDSAGQYYIPTKVQYTLLALNNDKESWSVVDDNYLKPLTPASNVILTLPDIKTVEGTTLQRKVMVYWSAFVDGEYNDFVDEITFDIAPKPYVPNPPSPQPEPTIYVEVTDVKLQIGTLSSSPINPVFVIKMNLPVNVENAVARIGTIDCHIVPDGTKSILTVYADEVLEYVTNYNLELSGLVSTINGYVMKEPAVIGFVTWNKDGEHAAVIQKDREFTANHSGEYNIIPDDNYDAMENVILTVDVPLQTKTVNVNENGTIIVEPDDLYDGLSSVEIVTNVQPVLQDKTVTDNNVTIYPDSEFDGLSSVSIAVPIEPTRYETITKPGITSITPETGKVAIAAVNVTVTPDEDKEVEITTNGDTTVTASANKLLNTVTIHTNVPLHNVQNEKNVTITSLGTISVTPDSSYDCMRKVNVTVNIPAVNISLYAYIGTNTGLTFYSTKEITVSGDYNIIPKNDGGSFVDFATYTVTVSDVNINFEYDGAVEVLTRDSSSDVTR